MLFLGITFPARVAQQTYHFLYHPELYKAGSQRKPYGASQQQGNEDVGPEQVVYQIYYLHHVYLLGYVYLIKRLFLSKNKLLYKTDGWKEQSQPQPHSVVY